MAITQTITTIPTAGHRGVDARDTFVTKQEAFQDSLTDNFVTEINTFRTQANDLETNVNAKEASAVTAKDSAVLAQVAAELARDEAVGAVATLPDGIINDGIVSSTDTWSSEKIDADKQDTLVSGTNIKTIGGASILGGGDLVVGATDYQEFTTSGTWTKPAGATYVYIECCGGGGGGGANTTTTGLTGGGGGGAGVHKLMLASTLSATETITIGAGGAGGATGGANSGANGGNTTFGTSVTAYGGGGGGVGSYTDTFAIAKKGFGGLSISPTYGLSTGSMFSNGGYSSGSGAHGYSGGGGAVMGGGGGGGVSNSNGAGGISVFAGNGGAGNSTLNTKGGNGTYPSGGGGASDNNGGGGDGAAGRVRIWCW